MLYFLYHFMRRLTVLLLVLGLVILLAILYFPREKLTSEVEPEKQFTSAVSDVKSEVLEKLRAISELHTGVASVQTIVTTELEKKLLGVNVGSTKLLYVAVGQVRAGVMLSDINPASLHEENNIVRLVLPAPRILDAKVDIEKSYVYNVQKSSVLGPDAFDLQTAAQRKALQELTQTAVRGGLLQMAAQQARVAVSSLLASTGYANVMVEVSPPAGEVLTNG